MGNDVTTLRGMKSMGKQKRDMKSVGKRKRRMKSMGKRKRGMKSMGKRNVALKHNNCKIIIARALYDIKLWKIHGGELR